MSVKYTVTNYHFYEPKELTESQYLGIKQKLQNDPDYSIMDKNETITNEFNFKNLVYLFGGGFLGIIIGGLIGGDRPASENSFISFVTMILMFGGVIAMLIGGIGFMFGLPSMFNFSRYIKKKRRYFESLESAIRKSKNYDDFFNSFYK